jgi:hypothetical protein
LTANGIEGHIMADVIYPVTGRSISLRYKDMGDGTFAEVVSVIGASGSGADASAANQLTEIARLEAIRDRLPDSVGAKAGSGSFSVVPATDATFRTGTPRVGTRPTLINVQTAATGTNWAAFPSQACTAIDIVNTAVASSSPSAIAAATNIRWRYVNTTIWEVVREGASALVFVTSNANEVEIQRADGSNTQITVMARAYA